MYAIYPERLSRSESSDLEYIIKNLKRKENVVETGVLDCPFVGTGVTPLRSVIRTNCATVGTGVLDCPFVGTGGNSASLRDSHKLCDRRGWRPRQPVFRCRFFRVVEGADPYQNLKKENHPMGVVCCLSRGYEKDIFVVP